ncbi:MAG: hypothetical protein JSW25_01225 [Thermoplasmata archaeon]|nr:MAG: hypothetical protein JSW25_01225 [Thermoplasmata archaeon]
MRWSWVLISVAFALVIFSVTASADGDDGSYILYDAEDVNVTYGPFWTMDWNSTENITGELVMGQLDPYYGNEPFVIGALWPVFNLTEHPNRTVTTRIGLDEAARPDNVTMVMRYQDLYGEPDIQRLWFARTRVFPQVTNTVVVAEMDTGEGPLEMAHGINVQEDRVLLSARIGTENGTWENDELAWGSLPVLLVNDGGKGATELVVDIRYGGRIVGTEHVNLVPALGEHTFHVSIMPNYSNVTVEVYLVSGPLPPGTIGDLNITVKPRPILDIVTISALPEEVESGGSIHIEAVVRNRGNATTTGQVVELMVDGSIVANTTLEDLAPGEEVVVETDWTLRGEGIHSVSAIAEGDDFAAKPVAVKVEAASPSVGVWAVIVAMAVVSLVARRSASAGRA